MIPYGRQEISEDDIDEVVKVLKSDFLTTGPRIKEFEEKFADFVGVKYAVAVSNGTAALHLSCLAAGLKKDDELITSPITFVASANCALYCGAKPVFADINEKGLIDPLEIKKKISDRTKIIIPVHYGGMPCDMQEISKIAKSNNLVVIEDACHALGSKYKDSVIGDCKYSDMTVFSFHPVKHITTGEGGMITTNSKPFYERLMLLRTHGITKDPAKFFNRNDGPWYCEMQELGFNYRITDFQCALGISQLKRVKEFIKKRRKIAEEYDGSFSSNPKIEIIKEEKCIFDSYHLYIIKLKNKEDRLGLFNHLKNKGIFCQVHYIPVYWNPYYQKLSYKRGICPKSEGFYERIISLPIYPSLNEKDLKKVIEEIKNYLKN